MGSVLKQNPRGMVCGGEDGESRPPSMLTLTRGLRSLAEVRNGKQASASCCPGLAGFEGGGRSSPCALLMGSLRSL